MNWKERFEYRDNNLYYKIGGQGRKDWKTKPIGCEDDDEYRRVGVNGKLYMVHRIIYEMHHEQIPDDMIVDHIDGNRSNNDINNLRLATKQQNQMNRKINSNKKFKLPKNVFRHGNRYRVIIRVDGKNKYAGTYPTIEDAVLVAIEVRKKYHGDFVRHE